MNPRCSTMSKTFSSLVVEQQGEIALAKLNRPEKRNALNDATIAELSDFFSGLSSSTKVVVLHGEGEHFCAGLDLAELLAKGPKSSLVGARHSRGWHEAFERIQYAHVPVISVLKGGVIGGGLELAAATHIRVCEPSTFFQLPEGQRGIFTGGGASVRVSRLIGPGRMIEMMLTGRRYDASDGIRLGLGHYLTEPNNGLALALELAHAVARNAVASNYAIINGIARIAEMSPAEGLFAETMVASMTTASESADRIRDFFATRGK